VVCSAAFKPNITPNLELLLYITQTSSCSNITPTSSCLKRVVKCISTLSSVHPSHPRSRLSLIAAGPSPPLDRFPKWVRSISQRRRNSTLRLNLSQKVKARCAVLWYTTCKGFTVQKGGCDKNVCIWPTQTRQCTVETAERRA
jgi:hypothetical protein